MSWDFEGCVVLVTGAAHGQGASHAQAFAEAGADVAICDIAGEMEFVEYQLGTVTELEQVAEGVRAAGSNCLSTVCDVRRPEEVRDFVERTVAEFGRLDVAICNAGIGTPGYLREIPLGQWEETIETDFNGPFYTCKYAARPMIAAGSGRIVVTGSTQTFSATSWTGPYAAAKHGLLAMVQGFAAELQPHGVGVNLICPTAVDTPLNAPFDTEGRYQDWAEEVGKIVGSWNLFQESTMHEREVTEAILWLSSEEAGAASGTAFLVDAGFACK